MVQLARRAVHKIIGLRQSLRALPNHVSPSRTVIGCDPQAALRCAEVAISIIWIGHELAHHGAAYQPIDSGGSNRVRDRPLVGPAPFVVIENPSRQPQNRQPTQRNETRELVQIAPCGPRGAR